LSLFSVANFWAQSFMNGGRKRKALRSRAERRAFRERSIATVTQTVFKAFARFVLTPLALGGRQVVTAPLDFSELFATMLRAGPASLLRGWRRDDHSHAE
jgi:hypothetical protein